MVKKEEAKVEGQEHPLWTQVKNLKVNMFSLPNQVGGKFCELVTVQGDKIYLRIKVQAFLPALEEALGSDYSIEQTDLYTIVSKKV